MVNWSPSDVAMIITSVTAGVCSVIAAWKATKTDKKADIAAKKSEDSSIKADINSSKLDEIHTLTNGNLSRTQEELEIVKKQKDFLDKLVIELAAKCPPGTLEKATKEIEVKQAQIGKRRKSDLSGDGNSRKEDRV